MKTVLTKIGNFIIAWAEVVYEYRSAKGYRNGGYY
jgi:hypothetical protein